MQDCEVVRFQIEIQRVLADGALNTKHYPVSQSDRDILNSWPSGGLVQVAHAFMLETIRREAHTMAIAMISQGVPKEQMTSKELSERVVGMTLEFCQRFCEDICRETLSTISELSER